MMHSKRMITLGICASLLAGQALAVNTDVTPKSYRVSSAPVEPLQLDAPKLPDLTPFTPAAVEARIERKPAARVSVRRMIGLDQLSEFTGGDERLREWVVRQGGMPEAILVEGGYITPAGLAKALGAELLRETAPGVYLLRRPLVVMPGATLHIDQATKDFRLSSDRGAFIIGLQTRPDQAAEALKVSQDVLRKFIAEGPSDKELKAAKDNLIGGFALRIDSNRKLLGNVAKIAWNGLPLDYLEHWTDRVQALTTKDVKEAMQRMVQPERMVTITLGAKP